ncbi:MAG: glycosyltransferase [Deltaproteobacteria bacterium]|nr:glycosyltransferase [Deltaproteobacteria bacterium]
MHTPDPSPRMRLALLGRLSQHPGRNRGGASLRLGFLAKSWLAAGYAVDLLTSDPQHDDLFTELADLRGLRRIALPTGGKLRLLPRLAAYLWRQPPTALYAFDSRAAELAALMVAARVYRGQFFSVFCSPGKRPDLQGNLGISRRRRQRIAATIRRSDKIIAISAGLAEEYRKLEPIANEKLAVIYNGVLDLPTLNDAGPPPHPWLAKKDLPVLMSAGRLVKSKDFRTLLLALHRVPRPVRLIILGEGPERASLGKLALELGLEGKIFFAGFVTHPQTWMFHADLFISSSLYEGFGNVIVEALAAGCPVIATDCPHGPREIIEQAGSGRLIPTGDAAALAAAITEGLELPPAPAEAARLKIFTKDHAAAAYLDLLSFPCEQNRKAR